MVNHWLYDVLQPEHRLSFVTHQASLRKPHGPDDALALRTQMVEAMDDSILIAPSLMAAQTAGLHAERFQAAYGWETSWPKSLLAILGPVNPPASAPIAMPSVNPADPDSLELVYHPVPVSTSHCEFLRVQINDPEAQYLKLRHMILDFRFPHLHTRLPFTALRRILSQCLISRIRPALSYQPIARSCAADLDRLLAHQVHDYLGFPFHFNSSLLFLPLEFHGFAFPSVSHLNDVAAVSGLLRDLNHHVPTFRSMARLTLADWTCQLNACLFPLEGPTSRSFSRSGLVLPFSWIVALDVLRTFHLSVRSMDQSHLLAGDVALRHLVRGWPPPPSSPSSLAVSNLERAGFTHLSQLASWEPSSGPDSPLRPDSHLVPHPHVTATLRPFSASRDWPAVQHWLQHLTLQDVVFALTGLLRLPVASRHSGALLEDDPLPPSFSDFLASDASASNRHPPLIFGHGRRVTFAAASASASVILTIAPNNALASSLHGEVFALITAALLHLHRPATLHPSPPTLFTDHLNSVRFVASYVPSSPSRPQSQSSALPLYIWLLDLLTRIPNPPRLQYTPAHTSATTVPAQANAFVDTLASSRRYIDSASIPCSLQTLSARSLITNPASRPNLTLFRCLYDLHSPPPHPYTRASSAFSATVQLYARSSQLATAWTRCSRFRDAPPVCHFGCAALESAHHLFVLCPHFATFRDDAFCAILRDTSALLESADVSPLFAGAVLRIARTLFSDDGTVWPQFHSHYFLGTIPAIPSPPPGASGADSLPLHRLRIRLANLWHTASIRLAARIWGQYIRAFSCPVAPEPVVPSLPPHLAHLAP
ncbi:hypothetical protein LXA43DRAFT_877648 [Ganoderma leucocontextum]|nr:hypothetical protein LXA43DRAFT_877648 [Ganoderma leucocontextum]